MLNRPRESTGNHLAVDDPDDEFEVLTSLLPHRLNLSLLRSALGELGIVTLLGFCLGALARLLLTSVLLFLRLLLSLLLSLELFFALAFRFSGFRLQVEWPLILVLGLVILVLHFEAHRLILLKVVEDLTQQLVRDSVRKRLVQVTTGARANLGAAGRDFFFFLLFFDLKLLLDVI